MLTLYSWFDSDTVLMNPNMPLETFLPPPELPNVHLLTSRGWNGLRGGVFFLRVHPWSVELLSAAIAYPVVKPNVQLMVAGAVCHQQCLGRERVLCSIDRVLPAPVVQCLHETSERGRPRP